MNSPVGRLFFATIGLIFLLKLVAVIRNRKLNQPVPTGLGWIAYLFFWPGLRPESFTQRSSSHPINGGEFVAGFLFFVSGVILQLALPFAGRFSIQLSDHTSDS